MADVSEHTDSLYQRPSVREVYEKAISLPLLRERRDYLRRVIIEDEHNGFLRDPEVADDGEYIEGYEFTRRSVRLSRGALHDPDSSAEFERQGEFFRAEVRELLEYFEEVGDPAISEATEENVMQPVAEAALRIPWSDSQNTFIAWLRLSYEAFMSRSPDPYKNAANKSEVIEKLGRLFEYYDSEKWSAISVETVKKRGIDEAVASAMESVLTAIRQAHSRLSERTK